MAPPSMIAKVEAALPGTVLQIVAKTGLVESTVRRWLVRLRADGKAHISKRLRNVGGSTPVWIAGPGEDAPPIVPYTSAQYSKRFRRRVKKAIAKAVETGVEDKRYANKISKHIAGQTVAQTRAKPNTWLSALGAM